MSKDDKRETPITDAAFDLLLTAMVAHNRGEIFHDDLLAHVKQGWGSIRDLERQLDEEEQKFVELLIERESIRGDFDCIKEQLAESQHQVEKYAAEAKSAIEENERLFRELAEAREDLIHCRRQRDAFKAEMAENAEQRDEWKRSHDHVCKELASCEDQRDANARLCEEAQKQRDTLAEALRMCERHLARHENEMADEETSDSGWMVLCEIRTTLATLEQKGEG